MTATAKHQRAFFRSFDVGRAVCKGGFILLCLLALCATSCKREPKDPEQEVRAYVAQMEQYAEDEKLSKIKEMIADDFSGNGGADKQTVGRMLFVLFKKRDKIHLLTQIQEIEFPDKKTAEVKLIAGLAAKDVDSFSALEGLRTDMMHFTFTLKHDGEWLAHRVRWKRATLADIISED